jgi:hypothetical protein
MKNANYSPSTNLPLRVLVEQTSGSEILVSTSAWLSLAKKAGKNSLPLSIVEQVYVRGFLEANPNSQNSIEQQAFQRVDSFIHGGKAVQMDEDLLNEMIAVPQGKNHMHIVKNAIKRYQTLNRDTT